MIRWCAMNVRKVYRFPGMDPWLEHPAIWPDVHHRVITYLADALAAQIAPRYTARHGERVVIEPTGRQIAPDVVVKARPLAGGASTAVADAPMPRVVLLPELYVRQPYLEIRDRHSGNRVVTVMEVLSPSNKRAGSDARRKYIEKQEEVLRSDVNLVEIDLLRGGEPTVAFPEEYKGDLGPFHYLMVTRRAGRRTEAEVYAIPLAKPLPSIRVPLTPPDGDAVADLQTLIERAYEAGGYDRDLDYARSPEPPLGEADWIWTRQVVAGAGTAREE